MNLKERILKEMVVDPLALEIFNELPTELRTPEKLDEIQDRLRNSSQNRQSTEEATS